IRGEMVKASRALQGIVPLIQGLFNLLFSRAYFPSTWRIHVLVPLFKQGDQMDPTNYRGIAMKSVLAKLYVAILNSRMVDYLESNGELDEAQGGFRKDRRTTDQLFILHTLINKCTAKKRR
ncbi:hypothetical protein CGU37_27305, partial [Pseudomonas fluorescens]